jgi:hypothetical protein
MRAFLQDDWRERWSFLSMLHCGLVIAGLALTSAAFVAGGGGGGGGGGSAADASRAMGGDSGGWRQRSQDEQVGPHDLRAWNGLGHQAS